MIYVMCDNCLLTYWKNKDDADKKGAVYCVHKYIEHKKVFKQKEQVIKKTEQSIDKILEKTI
jgi:hypothetical protein